MPEGDTIFLTAKRLHTAAAGRRIERFRALDPRLDRTDVEGAVIDGVEARAKHLLMHLSDGTTLHTHMQMKGKWRIAQRRASPQSTSDAARIVIDTEAVSLICSLVQSARWIDMSRLPVDDWLHRIGPDILSPQFDVVGGARRLLQHAELSIAEALLDQGAVSGIGNVYKCETLFLCETDPRRPATGTSEQRRVELLQTCRKWMLRNLERGPRRTRFGPGGPVHWVYERAGQRCLKCDTLVEVFRQGVQLRPTYYCPDCQR